MSDSDSSSEGEIDLERERLRSLSARRSRRHDAHVEKIRIAETLKQYREEQSKRRDAEAANARAHFFAANRDSVRSSTLPSRNRGDDGKLGRQAWEDHERRWAAFESMIAAGGAITLCEQDIPWPPTMEGILRCMVEAWTGVTEEPPEETLYKQAYHKATRRWHPDKFMSKVGGVIHEESHERVMARVMGITQQLNREWGELRPGWVI